MTRPNPKASRQCVECGAEFLTGNATVVACSAECRRARQRRQIREHHASNYVPIDHPERQCVVCSAMFKPNKGDKVYCSRRCLRTNEDTRKHRRRYRLKKRYGLTEASFDGLLASQGGRCAVCGADDFGGKGPVVDHDHHSGRVRGILCDDCNVGIGRLGDDPHVVSAAAEYLLSHLDSHPLSSEGVSA